MIDTDECYDLKRIIEIISAKTIKANPEKIMDKEEIERKAYLAMDIINSSIEENNKNMLAAYKSIRVASESFSEFLREKSEKILHPNN